MIKPFVILLFLSLSCSSIAQINVDSLKEIWRDQTQADTNRLKALDEICFKHYLRVNLDSALIYSEKMLDFATQKGLKKYQADALHNMGIAQGFGNPVDAIITIKRGLKLREELGIKRDIGRSLSNLGSMEELLGEKLTALNLFRKALGYFEEVNDKILMAHALLNMGSIHSNSGDYPKAISYFSRSLKLIEEPITKTSNNSSESFHEIAHVNTLIMMAGIYVKMQDYERVKSYAEKVKIISERIKYQKGSTSALQMLGYAYEEQGKFSIAMRYYLEALDLANESRNSNSVVSIYSQIGNVYKLKGEYSDAIEFYMKALDISESLGLKQTFIKQGIGDIYLLKKENSKAMKWCKEAYAMAQEVGGFEDLQKACNCLYSCYKMLGNGNKALFYHEQYLSFSDSLQIEEAGKKLQQMDFQKQLLADSLAQVEKDLVVQLAHKEEVRKKNNTRNILLSSGLLLLFLSGGLFSRWRHVKRSREVVSKERDRSENLLLNILPAEIAEELKEKGEAAARNFETVSILFTDFKQFTEVSENLSATELVEEINTCFKAFDEIVGKYNIEKIKTIGDSYMAAGGLPVASDTSVKNTVLAALEMQTFITQRKAQKNSNNQLGFTMRAGVNTGPVVAGIVGVKKFQYDVWGDTVNIASRMESGGEIGEVNISQHTYELLKDDRDFIFESRGKIQAKGKGEVEMYFVRRA